MSTVPNASLEPFLDRKLWDEFSLECHIFCHSFLEVLSKNDDLPVPLVTSNYIESVSCFYVTPDIPLRSSPFFTEQLSASRICCQKLRQGYLLLPSKTAPVSVKV